MIRICAGISISACFIVQSLRQMLYYNLAHSTRQGMNGGMLKDTKTNSLLSLFQYSLLPEPVPFSVLESGAIFSTKVFDYEKDPHW